MVMFNHKKTTPPSGCAFGNFGKYPHKACYATQIIYKNLKGTHIVTSNYNYPEPHPQVGVVLSDFSLLSDPWHVICHFFQLDEWISTK